MALFTVFPLSVTAQTEEPTPRREKQKWAIGGMLTLLAPDFDYYDKNRECYKRGRDFITPHVWERSGW